VSTPSRSRVAVTLAAALLGGAIPAPARAGEVETRNVVRAGVYSDQFWAEADLGALDAATGRAVTFGGTFHSLSENEGMSPGWSNTREGLEQVWRAGATPFANLAVTAVDESVYGRGADAAVIAAGAWDAEIDRWIDHLAQFLDRGGGRSVIVAPLQEMNGDWVPYGCDPASYPAAYRRIVDRARNRGLDETRVRWAFAPNGWTSPGCGSIADYYPGHDYVDILGVSVFTFGDCARKPSPWLLPSTLLQPPLAAFRVLAPHKPYLIAQTGAPHAECGAPPDHDQDSWVRDLFAAAAADGNVAGLVYFNIDTTAAGETDWRVWREGIVRPGWVDAMHRPSTRYEWPLTEWFVPGELVAETAPLSGAGIVVDASRFHGGTAAGWMDDLRRFFAASRDWPLLGDWDCDGSLTPGVYRQSDGLVRLLGGEGSERAFHLGNAGDVPLVGDWNGDGCDTVSVYRPAESRFYISNRLGPDGGRLGSADRAYVFGNPGDQPFVGDWNGDGVDTVGLWRESAGLILLHDDHGEGVAHTAFHFGNPGDKPVVGDWNGDGRTTVAVYRPSTRTVHVSLGHAGGVADFATRSPRRTWASLRMASHVVIVWNAGCLAEGSARPLCPT
jgi:hypothetical protein